MSDTLRGLMVFVSALVTLGLFAPLSSKAERGTNGTVITESYFGVFKYMTLKSEMKEPDYNMTLAWNYPRLAVTVLVTSALWGLVTWKLRVTRRSQVKTN